MEGERWETALLWAVFNEREKCVKSLIEVGSKMDGLKIYEDIMGEPMKKTSAISKALVSSPYVFEELN